MKIIILEDQAIMSLFLEESLITLGYEVIAIFNNALDLLKETNKIQLADLIIVDISLKGRLNGIQAAEELKLKYSALSVVFITSYKDSATIQQAQVVSPLAYLVKPINQYDLEATLMVVESQNLKNNTKKNSMVRIANYLYDKEKSIVYHNDNLVKLSKKEQSCIKELVRNLNAYVSIEQLSYSIWSNSIPSNSSLRELVFRLRKKLPDMDIKSDYNYGYMLKNI